jgi:hypothetical protein
MMPMEAASPPALVPHGMAKPAIELRPEGESYEIGRALREGGNTGETPMIPWARRRA